jgi:hypothetical protein
MDSGTANDGERAGHEQAAQIAITLFADHPICEICQCDSNAVSRHLGPLARHHICELQFSL